MKDNTFKKHYVAIVNGILDKKFGTICAPIARKENSIIERCINSNGSYAVTEYSVIKELDGMSLIYLGLKTGRTHQIRVHMSYIGHPIIGDTLYGVSSSIITRQALHACKISFIHPISKKYITFESDLPKDIESLLQMHKMS